MQALREATAPQTRTRWWQWVVVGIMLLGYAGYVALALPKWYRDLRNDLQ